MIVGFAVLFVLGLILTAVALSKDPAILPRSMSDARKQLITVGLRLPLSLLAASFLAQIVPAERIAAVLGPGSGATGLFVATAAGAIIPGGPFLTFPLALVIWRSGAGEAQMVAFLASWSIFAVNRILTYEWPLLGGRFVLLRLASSWMLPPIAGALAMAAVAVTGGYVPV